MSRPAKLPRWSDVGGTIVEPTEAKKNIGWITSEKPPASFFNWLLNLIYQWVLWFNNVTLGTQSATALVVDGVGGNTVTPVVGQILAAPTSGNVDAIKGSGVGSGDGGVFRGGTTGIGIVGFGSTIGEAGALISTTTGVAALRAQSNGGVTDIAINSLGRINITGDIASVNDTVIDQITRRSVIKAYGVVSIDSGTGVASLVDGFNIASLSNPGAGNVMTITMASPFANALFCVTATIEQFPSAGQGVPRVNGKTAPGGHGGSNATFDFAITDFAGGYRILKGAQFSFHVFGVQ